MRRKSKNLKLLTAMARVGMTGIALASETHLHPGTISGVLNDRVAPKTRTIAAIAKALHSAPEELGFEEGGDS